MAEWERISLLDIVWQRFGRVCAGGGGGRRGSMVAVLKCRVSINGEMREGGRGGEEDGCRSALSDNGVLLVGGGGGVEEGWNVSSQQAGVVTSECQTNKLLTQIHRLHGAILKHTQCSRQSQGDRAQTQRYTQVVRVLQTLPGGRDQVLRHKRIGDDPCEHLCVHASEAHARPSATH